VELYVGNLPWSINDDGLTQLFAAHGSVKRAKVVMDRETGRSRGFGFVTMGSAQDGQQAITALNGTDCEGRPLRVRAAEPKPPGGGAGGGGGFGGGGSRGGDRGPRGGGYGDRGGDRGGFGR
jgi:RNA recognition motif-containing protein